MRGREDKKREGRVGMQGWSMKRRLEMSPSDLCAWDFKETGFISAHERRHEEDNMEFFSLETKTNLTASTRRKILALHDHQLGGSAQKFKHSPSLIITWFNDLPPCGTSRSAAAAAAAAAGCSGSAASQQTATPSECKCVLLFSGSKASRAGAGAGAESEERLPADAKSC